MLKVIQVIIQEYASCIKKSLEIAWFDRSNLSFDRLNPNMYLQNSISAQTLLKRIGFQVKHY